MKVTLACSISLVLTLAACGGQPPAEVVNKNTLNYQKSEHNPSFALAMQGQAEKGVIRGKVPAGMSPYHASPKFFDSYGVHVMPEKARRDQQQIAAQRFEYDPSMSYQAEPVGGSIAVSEVAPIQTSYAQPNTTYVMNPVTVSPKAEPVITYAPTVQEPGYLEPIAPIANVSESSLMDSKVIASTDFIWPTQGKLLSGFGPKENGLVNDGINISADAGEPIWSAADGEVAYVGNELKGYGNMLIVRHDNGWMSAYAHAQNWAVTKGTRVKQGQLIGYVGQSGNAEVPQLHFGLRQNRTPVDPTGYLPRNVASR